MNLTTALTLGLQFISLYSSQIWVWVKLTQGKENCLCCATLNQCMALTRTSCLWGLFEDSLWGSKLQWLTCLYGEGEGMGNGGLGGMQYKMNPPQPTPRT